MLGQIKTDEKSNEIRVIPELLRLLEIKGCLVSIDAMDCQKQIAQQIIDQNGDYLLAVKGNQARLHGALEKSFQNFDSIERQEIEQQKSRLEGLSYQLLNAVVLPAEIKAQWPQLKTVAMTSSYRMTKEQAPCFERRYFLSSAELDVDQFAHACRIHWLIENQLHWVLDVSMNKDNSQIYRENAAANLVSIRHMSLNMLRQDTS